MTTAFDGLEADVAPTPDQTEMQFYHRLVVPANIEYEMEGYRVRGLPMFLDGTTDTDVKAVTIEYEHNVRLTPVALESLRAEIGDYAADELLYGLYEALVEALFPGYAGRDEPWEIAPLHVQVETVDTTVSLGGFY